MKETKNRQATSLIIGLVLVTSLFAGAAVAFTVWQQESPHQSVGLESGLNSTNSSIPVHQPPRIANGTTLALGYSCANFSQPYTPQYQLAPTATAVNPTSYVSSVTITIVCNDCSSTDSSTQTSPQWSGNIVNAGQTIPVNGICDARYMVDRHDTSAWVVSWSFQRLTAQGTLEISVALNNNQSVIFDHSVTGSINVVTGSFNIPSGN